ncbi:MAG: murein biosynthesis integral membrane protein MurJ [Moorellales bacterium]
MKAERLVRATLLILVFTLVSRGLGFLRDAIVAWAFGATAATDAYMVAYTLPYFLQSVLGVALVTVMVPVVSRYLAEEKREEAWSVTSSVVNFMGLVFATVAAAGILAAGPLVRALAPGFAPQQSELAAELTRIMFPSLVFVGVGMLLSGVLNAGWHFGLPALAPGVANAVMILAVLVFGSRYFIYALAWGTLAGFVAFFWVQWPGLRRLGFRYRWRWDLAHPEVRRALGLVPGVVFALSVNQIYLAINRFVASGLVPGSITALDLAFRVLNLPLAIFATSLSTALFPALSRQAARSDLEGLGQSTLKGLSGLMVLMIPLSLGLALLHQPVVRLIFQRGVFGASGTALTATALFYFSFGLAGLAASLLLTRACYALGEARIPARAALASIALDAVLSLSLSRSLAHGGLALANSLAATANAALIFYGLSRRLETLRPAAVLGACGRTLLASLPALALVGLFLKFWPPGELTTSGLALELAVASLAGGGCFLLLARALNFPEMKWLIKVMPGK